VCGYNIMSKPFWGQLKVLGPRTTPFDLAHLNVDHPITSRGNGINTGGPSHYSHGDWMLTSNGPIERELLDDGPSAIMVATPEDSMHKPQTFITRSARRIKTVKGRRAPGNKGPMGRPVENQAPHPFVKDSPRAIENGSYGIQLNITDKQGTTHMLDNGEPAPVEAPEPVFEPLGNPMQVEHPPVFRIEQSEKKLLLDVKKALAGRAKTTVAKRSGDRRAYSNASRAADGDDEDQMRMFAERLAAENARLREDSMNQINQVTSRLRDQTENYRAELNIAHSVNRDAIAQAEALAKFTRAEQSMREETMHAPQRAAAEERAVNLEKLRQATMAAQHAEMLLRNHKIEADAMKAETAAAIAALHSQRAAADAEARMVIEMERLNASYRQRNQEYKNSEAYIAKKIRTGFVPSASKVQMPTSTTKDPQMVVQADNLGLGSKRKASISKPTVKKTKGPKKTKKNEDFEVQEPPSKKSRKPSISMVDVTKEFKDRKRVRVTGGDRPKAKKVKTDAKPSKKRLAIEGPEPVVKKARK
jgi:hypothetical protein